MISQEYILPFPYLCQIYHLLNLKHLETVHNFSLNNLKIFQISHFQPTSTGGIIKFQTILDSPANPLRIWRQPIVEVDLILHTPYTVELSIPVYNNKRIIVLFILIYKIDVYRNPQQSSGQDPALSPPWPGFDSPLGRQNFFDPLCYEKRL